MNKISVYLLAVLFVSGCEKNFESVVEPADYNYQVIMVEPVDPFIYVPNNSTLLKIKFNSTEFIKNVTLNIFNPTEEKLFDSPVKLTLIDNNIYTFVLRMKDTDISGTYIVKYYVTDLSDKTTEAAVQKFDYNNGSANTAPVISEVLIEPDSIVVTDTTFIRITAKITDEQGLKDIELAYFIVYRPDSSTSGNQTILNDNGIINETSWDEVAGDGIFSRMIFVDQNNTKGTYRFEFRARDRGRLLSNIYSYNVLIQ